MNCLEQLLFQRLLRVLHLTTPSFDYIARQMQFANARRGGWKVVVSHRLLVHGKQGRGRELALLRISHFDNPSQKSTSDPIRIAGTACALPR